MAKDDFTKLTADELKECMATGASITDVKELQTQGHSFEDIKEILDIQREERDAAETRRTQGLTTAFAEVNDRDRIPENKHRHPRKSVFNPLGEYHKRINPTGLKQRPQLSCETIWTGVPMEGDVDTNEELELVEQIKTPGVYSCTMNDGGKFRVTVSVEYQSGTRDVISRKIIHYKQEKMSQRYPSRAAIMRELIAQTPQAPVVHQRSMEADYVTT